MTAFFQFLVVWIPGNYKATQFPKTCAYNLGKAKSFGTSQSALPRTITLFLNWSKRFYELSNVLTLWTTHEPESVLSRSLCCCGRPHTLPHFQSLQLQLCSHFCSLWFQPLSSHTEMHDPSHKLDCDLFSRSSWSSQHPVIYNCLEIWLKDVPK